MVEHVTGQFRLISDCTLLDGGSLASHGSQHVGKHSSAFPYFKRSHHGCFGRPGAQGSAISAYNPLVAMRYVLHRQGFSSSVCQVAVKETQASTMEVYQQCWKEWAGWCDQEGVPNNAISAPKLAVFLVHLFRVHLAWYTIDMYHSDISAFLKPHHHQKTFSHSIISKLKYNFYLQCPPSCKCFDTWDDESLLLLLESWAPASSLTNFKLA